MKKLFVGNLPFAATDDIIRHIFEHAGPVRLARIMTDRETGRSRGFAFVEMEKEEDAVEAIRRFHGDHYDGRTITVSAAVHK